MTSQHVPFFSFGENVQTAQISQDASVLDIFDLDVFNGDDSGAGTSERVEYLKQLLPVVGQLWLPSSDHLELAAEKSADWSREPFARVPIGESGILGFFLDLLPFCKERRLLKLHALRLIGNACADVDNNRAQVLSKNIMVSLIEDLKDPVLSSFAILVIYNLCVDFEPAQQDASKHHLTRELLGFLSSENALRNTAFLEHAYELLGFMVAQEAENDHAPSDTGHFILNLIADENMVLNSDHFLHLLRVANGYLQQPIFKKGLVESGGMTTSLQLVVSSYDQLPKPEDYGVYETSPVGGFRRDEATQTELRTLQQFTLDMSSLPEFSTTLYPFESFLGTQLFTLIHSPHLELQKCACVLLGNLARSNMASDELVQKYNVHKPLYTILKTTQDPHIIFAVLSLFNNLCVLPHNKPELGATLIEHLPYLWASDNIPIQHASIRLTRGLLMGSWENVRKFYRRLSQDKDSPAHTRSRMSLLLAIFRRTENEKIKIEISRLVTAFCRVGSERKSKDAMKLQQNKRKFYSMHPELCKPLAYMIMQQESTTVRSEGWFTLALLTATPEGVECIDEVLTGIRGMQALVETLRGRKILDGQPSTPGGPSLNESVDQFMGESWGWARSPKPETPMARLQATRMANIDKGNAKTILTVLVNSRQGRMDPLQLSMYEDLLADLE